MSTSSRKSFGIGNFIPNDHITRPVIKHPMLVRSQFLNETRELLRFQGLQLFLAQEVGEGVFRTVLHVVYHRLIQNHALFELGILALLEDAGYHIFEGGGIGLGRVQQLLEQLQGRLQVGVEAIEISSSLR